MILPSKLLKMSVNEQHLRTRVQMDLPERSFERLKALKEKTEAVSYAEVLKNALKIYEAIIQEIDSGNEIMIKQKDGQIFPYKVFL